MSATKLQTVLFLSLCSVGFACGSGQIISTKCRSYWYTSEKKTWAEARDYCNARGNHLVIPLDLKEAKDIMHAIFEYGETNAVYWTGLRSVSDISPWREAVCNDQLSASWRYRQGSGQCAKSYYGTMLADDCYATHAVVCGLEAEMADGACVQPYSSTANSATYTTVWRKTTRENAMHYCKNVLGGSLFNMATPMEMQAACAPLIDAGVADQAYWSAPIGTSATGTFTTCGNIPMTAVIAAGFFNATGQNLVGSNIQCIALVNDIYHIKDCKECHKFMCESPDECLN